MDKQSATKNSRSLARTLVALLLFLAVPFLAYRACTTGYDAYGYYVHVKDTAVFQSPLSGPGPEVVAHGRLLKEKILGLDQEIDGGDGPEKGKLRWYTCTGIDCDEGWERSFLPE